MTQKLKAETWAYLNDNGKKQIESGDNKWASFLWK